jgi:hypothetical protein
MDIPWSARPVIYEINTWVWLSDLSRQNKGAITLGTVPAEQWDAIASLNVDAVWLMGAWERSPAGIRIANANAGLQADFRNALHCLTKIFHYHVTLVFLFLDLVPLATRIHACRRALAKPARKRSPPDKRTRIVRQRKGDLSHAIWGLLDRQKKYVGKGSRTQARRVLRKPG